MFFHIHTFTYIITWWRFCWRGNAECCLGVRWIQMIVIWPFSMFPFFFEFGRWISHVRDKKNASLCFMRSVLPGAWCFACIALRSVTICNFWDSKPRSISEIVFSAMTSAKRSTNSIEPFKQKWWWIFFGGDFQMLSFWILPRNQQKTNPTPNSQPTQTPNQPNQPNQRRKRAQKVFGDPSCKAKRLGAWQKEQILFGALVTPCYNYGCYRWCFLLKGGRLPVTNLLLKC